MKKHLLLLLTSCSLFGLNELYAQPEGHYFGCHHAQNFKMQPLTPAQQAKLMASNTRSDSLDILHYNINLDIIDFQAQTIGGFCEVEFTPKVNGIDILPLDLLDLAVDSVTWNGTQLSYNYDNLLLEVDLPATMNINDTATIAVHYGGTPTPDPNWGGFRFQNGYAYNLGIGLSSNPVNMGRSWYPCFDNFVERSTYEFHIRTGGDNRAYCIGSFLGETSEPNNLYVRHYEMNQLVPTYLVNVAVAEYAEVNYLHTGAYGTIPVQLVARPQDTAAMNNSFQYLGDAIDAIESWYGAYWWERVGYVATPMGAMEHPTNIAYPTGTGLGGPTFGQNRLMTHELGHCWWGNVVTLKTPSDMWIKEGNAEYTAHLFTEYTFGEDEFIDQVKANLNDVLTNAHFDDNGFWQLSGIPFEHTYGTHTYRKGASMLHNMRTYMGDSLFQVGQTSVLNTFPYSAINATEYRDHLNAATGLDMTNFFNDWIFSPGFSAFELNSMDVTDLGGSFDVTVEIEQKLRGATNLHTDVPIEITFVDANWGKTRVQGVVSGSTTTLQFNVATEPLFAIVNEKNRLNLAHLATEKVYTQTTGEESLQFSEASITIQNVGADSVYLWCDHYWIAPDEPINNPNNGRISSTHYWRFEGVVTDDFVAQAKLSYNIGNNPRLDEDLVSITEDSLVVLYRRDATQDWTEYPHTTHVTIFNSNDGVGYFFVDSLQMGEYAFANGEFPVYINVEEVQEEKRLNVYPNPAVNTVYVEGDWGQEQEVIIELIDIQGRVLIQQNEPLNSGSLQLGIDVSPLAKGNYFIKVSSTDGEMLDTEQIIVQ